MSGAGRPKKREENPKWHQMAHDCRIWNWKLFFASTPKPIDQFECDKSTAKWNANRNKNTKRAYRVLRGRYFVFAIFLNKYPTELLSSSTSDVSRQRRRRRLWGRRRANDNTVAERIEKWFSFFVANKLNAISCTKYHFPCIRTQSCVVNVVKRVTSAKCKEEKKKIYWKATNSISLAKTFVQRNPLGWRATIAKLNQKVNMSVTRLRL